MAGIPMPKEKPIPAGITSPDQVRMMPAKQLRELMDPYDFADPNACECGYAEQKRREYAIRDAARRECNMRANNRLYDGLASLAGQARKLVGG